MRSNQGIIISALVLMTLLSMTNLFGIPAAGLSVILGLVAFFVVKRIEKQPRLDSGLDIASIGKSLKTPRIWYWIIMPSIMNFFVIFLSKLILPEYINHVLERSSALLSFDKIPVLVLQLAVLALGEEIAWRAFFQKRIKGLLPIIPAIIISSVFFSLGHLADGNTVIVLYDLFFVFVNSILYGTIFEKTNNAWISTIAHFCANLTALLILFFL